jgi:hypothetical protein
MVVVIPRKKVPLLRNSVCIGIAYSEVRNGVERNRIPQKMFFKIQPSVFLCPRMVRNKFPEWFGKNFQQIFLLLNGAEFRVCFSSAKRFGTEFRAILSSAEGFGTKLRSSECFSLLGNGFERNAKHFYLPQSG